MRLFDTTAAPVGRQASNRPAEAGEDQRVETDSYGSHPHHQSFHVKTEASIGFDLAETREVEVQAFLLDGSPQVAVVALRIAGPYGSGDVLCSAAEMRAICLAGLRAADDCDRLRSGEQARV